MTETKREELFQTLRCMVIKIVYEKYKNTSYDKNDLITAGYIGLIKAIDSFNENKNTKLSSYAYVCITNSIIDYIKTEKNKLKVISIDEEDNLEYIENYLLKDTINIKNTLEEDVINSDLYIKIRKIIEILPNRDKEVIILYFGFNNEIEHNQKTIAKRLNLSQPYVSRILTKNLKKIKTILLNENYIDIKRLNYTRF